MDNFEGMQLDYGMRYLTHTATVPQADTFHLVLIDSVVRTVGAVTMTVRDEKLRRTKWH
jgi:hypothetical protein